MRSSRPTSNHFAPLPSAFVLVQKSIVEFLTSAQHAQDPLHRRLFNPLSAEFGVYKRQDLDYMIQTGFPHQKLVSFKYVVSFFLSPLGVHSRVNLSFCLFTLGIHLWMNQAIQAAKSAVRVGIFVVAGRCGGWRLRRLSLQITCFAFFPAMLPSFVFVTAVSPIFEQLLFPYLSPWRLVWCRKLGRRYVAGENLSSLGTCARHEKLKFGTATVLAEQCSTLR